METGRFWPICPKLSNLARISAFVLDQEKVVFKWRRVVSGPSALSGPEMVFAFGRPARKSSEIVRVSRKTFGNGSRKVHERSEMVWKTLEKVQK